MDDRIEVLYKELKDELSYEYIDIDIRNKREKVAIFCALENYLGY